MIFVARTGFDRFPSIFYPLHFSSELPIKPKPKQNTAQQQPKCVKLLESEVLILMRAALLPREQHGEFQSERNGEIQGSVCRYHGPRRNGGMSHAEPQEGKEACSGSLFP